MAETRFERESLKDQASRVEHETRMVLPGVQALWGFQLVVVFDSRFTMLSTQQQYLHWAALSLTAIASILNVAPAAFHRQAEPEEVTERFVHYSNCWLTLSLVPLMLGFCVDFYLIGIVISKNEILSLTVTLLLLAVFCFWWFVFPALKRLK